MTPRIPPKNASEFTPGSVIRLEFPAQGYVNPGKTTLEFDVVLQYTPLDAEKVQLRIQNNIQSIFSRVRLLYGATPLEDIPQYNVMIRALTEWTGTNQQGIFDQTSINEGIGGYTLTTGGRAQFVATSSAYTLGAYNTRQKYIQGIDMTSGIGGSGSDGVGVVPNATVPGTLSLHETYSGSVPVRRYQVQLALGIFNQEKLIPTKFMASQLAVEITLANPADCLYATETLLGAAPTYTVKNVNLIPEILEFDASYDESFLRGLQSGGVPIKFATWNHYQFTNAGSSSVNLQIQERSRSVKAIFAMQRRAQGNLQYDSGACLFNTDATQTFNYEGLIANGSTFQEYQYRIGGR